MRVVLALVAVALALPGCRCDDEDPPPSTGRAGPLRTATFTGLCDASAIVPLSGSVALVAGDEDNRVRAYDVQRGGAPLWSVDLSAALGSDREADLEAAARLGDVAWWMTSHGLSRSGKPRPDRLKLFATRLPTGAAAPATLEFVGAPYEGLVEDLTTDPALAPFKLQRAAEKPPKSRHGLNLEGLGPRRAGGLWLGFRNPIPKHRALLVPILNPDGLTRGARAQLGPAVTLDLGGLGVRDLAAVGDRLAIAAGSRKGGADHDARLYLWDEAGPPVAVSTVTLTDFNTEALLGPMNGGSELLLVSDDGGRELPGGVCKQLPASAQGFRGLWVPVSELPR